MRTAVLSAIAASTLALSPSYAQGAPSMRTIVVTGVGEASRAPDMAVLSLGVDATAPTAAEALRKNSSLMEATMKSLREAGVEKKDIQTSSLSISPQYDYSREQSPPRLIGYQATNSITVKLRNLEKAGGVIDKTVANGANRLDSISFSFADPKPIMNDARKSAVADARERAALYAEAAGVKLGQVVQISDSYTPTPGPIPYAMDRAMAAEAKSVPIAPGETVMSASVTIIYAID